jgi:hypothetical protein
VACGYAGSIRRAFVKVHPVTPVLIDTAANRAAGHDTGADETALNELACDTP